MKDVFQVVQWPEVQELFEYMGFKENSILINDGPLYSEYGDSAYLIRKSWLDAVSRAPDYWDGDDSVEM